MRFMDHRIGNIGNNFRKFQPMKEDIIDWEKTQSKTEFKIKMKMMLISIIIDFIKIFKTDKK